MRQCFRIAFFVVVILLTWASSEAQEAAVRTPFKVYVAAPGTDSYARDILVRKFKALRDVRVIGVCEEMPCDTEDEEDIRVYFLAYEARFNSGKATNYWNFSLVFAVQSTKKGAYFIMQHWMRTGVQTENIEDTCEQIAKTFNDEVLGPIRKILVHNGNKTASK